MTSLDWSQPLDQILGTIGQSVETGKIQSNFDENSDQNDRKSRLKEEYKVDDSTITAYEDVQKQSDKVIETQQELQNALDKTAEFSTALLSVAFAKCSRLSGFPSVTAPLRHSNKERIFPLRLEPEFYTQDCFYYYIFCSVYR